MAAEPDGAPRLPVLDVLRGVAILAILFMNMDAMGGPLNGFYLQDPRLLGWTGADQAVWWARQVLAEGTARCLLEMLFGAGMVILTDRAATRLTERDVLRGYAWRNVVLVAFGLVHVFVLLWPGDILHTYGLAALAAMGLRRLRPRLMLTLGLVLATLQLVGNGAAAIDARAHMAVAAQLRARQQAGEALTAPERAKLAAVDRNTTESAEGRRAAMAGVAAENRARTGTARSWVVELWRSFVAMERTGLELLFVWEAASTMLIGAALFRLGVLQGACSRRFYMGLVAVGYGIGLPLRAWGAWELTRFDRLPSLAFPFGEYARLLVTLGHLGVVQLLIATAIGAKLLRPFSAAGRTALTLYVLQTLATMWVLYPPWGLALYGRQGWIGLMLTALAIDAGLLALAVWWLRRFPIAPVEWAWRSIVAGRALPFRRVALPA